MLAVLAISAGALLPASGAMAAHAPPHLVSAGPVTGGNGLYTDFSGVPDSGTRSFFRTRENLTTTDTDNSMDVYERAGSATTLLSTGPSGGNGSFITSYGKASSTGSRTLFATNEKLTPDDTDIFLDVYERFGGVTTLVTKGSAGGNGPHDAYFTGSSADGTHVFFHTRESLVGSDTDDQQDLYQRYAGNTTLLSTGTAGGNGDLPAEWRGSTPDGLHIYFDTSEQLTSADTDTSQDVYEYAGGTTSLISTGTSVGGDPDGRAVFRFASTDGSRVMFNTRESFSAQDTDNVPDVYERSGGTTTLITAGNQYEAVPAPATFSAASLDGTKAYFETTEKLDAADIDALVDVYLRSGGTTTLVSGGGGNQVGGHAYVVGVSDDGSKVFFRTEEPLTGADTDPADDIYQWQSGTRTLLSIGAAGGNADINAHFAANSGDGSDLFFYTYESLVAADTDTVVDLYERTSAGNTYLISNGSSGGNGPFDVTFGGATPDGKRVFFQTAEQLTADDTDSTPDVYESDATGTVNVVLASTPQDPQDFDFTVGGGLSLGLGGGSTFQLDDDSDPTLSATRTITDVAPGSGYSVAQAVPAGWDQTAASCDNGSSPANISVGIAETVTCTFANRKRGRIVVNLDAQPDDAQDFSFTAGGGLSPASFVLDDDTDPTHLNSQSFDNLPPGAGYSLSQAVASGWALTGQSCSDGSPVGNVDVTAGETVTCTFTNRKRGSLVVVKDAQPNDPQDFSFTGGGGLTPASFSLDDDSNPTLSNTRTFASLSPSATYSLAETVPSGWDQSSATCDNGNSVSAISVPYNTTVTCTFTNKQRGSLVVIEDSVPDDAQDFSFTAGGGLSPTSFELDDDADATLSNTRTFSDLPAVSGYTLSETVPSPWNLSSSTCDNGSPVSNIAVPAGGTVTCTFTNNKLGRIVVNLDAQPDDPQDFSFTAGGGLSPTSFVLDDDTDPTRPNSQSFDNLSTGGGYSLSQAVPSGWALTGQSCSDGSPVANVNVSPGETVTCTFTNRKRGSLVVVKDAQPDDAQDFSFTAGGGLTPTSFNLDDDANATLSNTRTFPSLSPSATYSLAETVPSGWDQSSATCDNGNSVSAISVPYNTTVTCTFTNKKRGSLVVVQDSQPDDQQDFNFTAAGGLSPTSFTLDDHNSPTVPNTQTFTNVPAQSGYSITQTPVATWVLTSSTCSNGSPFSNITVPAGGTVTCTFVDQKEAQLTIVKDAHPNDAQDFGFTTTGLAPTSFSLDDDSNGALSNTRLFSGLAPGTYGVSETAVTGWDPGALTCSDGSPVTAIVLSAGENTTCTFNNYKRGSLTVTKDAVPNDPQDFSFAAGGGLSPASFSLDDDSDPTLSNTLTYTNLPTTPGSTYSFSESVPAGWLQTAATCSNGNSPSSITFTADTSTAVTCTFTNKRPGQINIVKDATPDDAQDFSFTTGGGLSPASFSLDDDTDPALSNTRSFTNLVPATYSVAETVPSGWDQTSATCSDGSAVNSIVVDSGETVTCTFANRKRGRIIVVKDATPNDAQDFSFAAGGGLSPSSFSLDDDADATLSNTQTFNNVVPGSGYSLSETVPGGWDQTSATCDDGSPITNVNVSANETVTCTFANRKRGQIIAVKDALPNDAQDFAFTAGGGLSPASFSLDDDADATLSNTRTFANVVPGSGYTLAETVPGGWDQTSATCSDGSSPSNIDVSTGEVVTCTWVNTKRATLTVTKDTQPNDPQDFAFTAGGGLSPASFSLDDDADATLSNTRTFANVVPGSGYTLAETVPSGWDQESATCSDGSPVSNVSLSPGENVDCTFTNTKRGRIVVVKDAQPDDPQDFAFTTGGGLSPGSFNLDDDTDATLSNTQSINNVATGSGYSVAETVPSGWDQSSATCDDGSPVTNISVSSNETVTCTFTNRQRGQIAVVKVAIPDDPQDFSFTAGGGLSPSSFSLDDDTNPTLSDTRTFSNVPAGNGYSLAESIPSGWAQIGASCSDGSPVANIDVSPGEHITCTFTNRKRGQIVVVKDATPNDPQDFAFTGGGGLSPTSFNLDDDTDPALSNTRTFANLSPISGYSLSESVPSGWDQSSAVCDDGSPVSNIDVSPGEIVTCTFSNTKRGQIVVVKNATPDDPQDFSFTAGGGLSPASFSLDDDADATLSNTRTFANVIPGSGYTLAESVPGGWDQTSATCSDGSSPSNVNVSAGEVVTCTWVNTKRATLTVNKDATPDDPQDFSFTAGGGLSPASFSLDDDGDPALSNTRTFANLLPGSGYSVSETVPGGWDQNSATCDDGSSVSNIGLSPGEHVTCDFVNQKRGQIVVVKDATPDDPQNFSFTAGGGLSPASFSLDDDGDPTLSNTHTYSSVPVGNGYSVSETVPSGWDQTSATCDDGSPVSNIDVSAGETVTCTFANRKRGQIVAVKDATPNDSQDFSFTAGGGLSPASFSLDDDSDPALTNSRTFANVVPGGAYSLSETVPSGWDQTSATCDDGSSVSNINVSAGETVTCTFANRKRGQIVVVKDATPSDPQDFAFATGGGLSPASFSLDDDTDPALPASQTINSVVPGTGYSVSETVPSGWDQTSATCSDGSPVSNIDVSAGETVTCTFANRKRGQIVVVKNATPDDPQDFSFTAGGGLSPASFSLDDDADATLSNTRTFANVIPGSGYTLAESVPGGWDQTSATCSDGSSPSNVNVSAGEVVTCTWVNTKRATLTVNKDATPDDPQDFSFTAGGGLSPASFSLDDDGDPALSNTRTFANLLPGSGYSVSETVPGGWDQNSATCDDGSSVSNIGLSPGEHVTCDFVNQKRGQIVVVKDATPDDPQNFSFTAGGGLSPASFSLDDDGDPTLSNTHTYSSVPVGNGYSVSETVPSGWDQTSATCDDGSPVSNIDVSAGETVTCTFANRKRGQIVAVKDATPNDSQDFSFTAGGGLSPASFSLDDDSDPALTNSRTFANVVPGGAYSLSETVPSGWDQTSATCDDGSSVSNINVSAGETVTCTFANRKRGQIVVVKDATPSDPQDFAFATGGGLSPASFSLDDDTDPALPASQTINSVVPGTGYSVSETVPSGWDQTSATCSDGSPVSNIDVSAGETVTCTFANRKRGQIVVVKNATPDDPQDFSFTAGGGLSPASFSLDDDADATLSNTRTFANVIPGSGYTLAESVPGGWDQTSATCSDGSPVSNVSIAAGETVTCTFANAQRASVTVVKDATPDDPQDFSFSTGGGLTPASFSLDDDSDPTLPNSHTFTNVLPGGGYSVSETVPSGWDQSSATCDDGSSVSAINLSAGEDVTCTFTNSKRGQIVVVQDSVPNDPQDFSFTAGGGLSPTTFQLDDDTNPALSNTRTFTNVPSGSGYSVSQAPVSGWLQSSASCDDGSLLSDIDVAPGETVTCTFTDTKRSRIVVVQDSVPNDPQDFSFTAGGGLSPTSFQLDDDSDGTLSNTRSFDDLLPGSGYSVAGSAPAGWDQSAAACDDGSPLSNIAVSAGETVTCTFTSVKRGRIVVTEDSVPNDPQDFSFTAGGGLSPTSFQLDDDSDPTLSNTRSFNDLLPDSGYSLSETVPGGWDQTAATCDDGSSPANIDVGPGETVTCTFANTKRGQLVIAKDAVPDDPQDFTFTTGGGLSPPSFQLDDDSDPTLSDQRAIANVIPGSGYSVAETVPTGWTQSAATCSDGSPPSNIDIAPGETVTCTFTNSRNGQIVVVADSTPNDPQDFSFTAGGGLSPTSFQLDDDSNPTLPSSRTFADVAPGGGYTVSETVPAGWDLGFATCDDGSPVFNISVSPGEVVTCTFDNTKRGQIVVVKDAQPNDPQDFSFTAGGGLSPASFQLDDDSNATLSNTRTFTNVSTGGGYSLSEGAVSGWIQSSATCDDGSSPSNIDVGPGETVTCTFTNSKRGQIVVVKDAQPNDPQDFSFTAGGGLSPASFQLDDDSDPTLSNTRTFTNLSPGAGYSIDESAVSGWTESSATCDDGSPVSNINVSAGETVTCTFTNTALGTIVVVKDAQPNNAMDFTFTAGGGLSPASFQLDDDSDPTMSNTRTFAGVAAGSGYSITETVPTAWAQMSATCSDGSPPGNINVALGETVTCTFVNSRGYPRPLSATPTYLPLVVAYDSCNPGNQTHAPPLSSSSCNPFPQSSSQLTVGTPDANAKLANFGGNVLLKAILGDGITPPDEADVSITFTATDVRRKADLADYTGQLGVNLPVRLTDRGNGPAENEIGTVQDLTITATATCTGTSGGGGAGGTEGSNCGVTTTVEAFLPGAVVEQRRSIWALGQVEVTDGGPDGLISTPAGNTVFLRQGVFAP